MSCGASPGSLVRLDWLKLLCVGFHAYQVNFDKSEVRFGIYSRFCVIICAETWSTILVCELALVYVFWSLMVSWTIPSC